MSTKSPSLRSDLYRTARTLGTLQAASKGPGALAKREVRREIYKSVNKPLGKSLRKYGL